MLRRHPLGLALACLGAGLTGTAVPAHAQTFAELRGSTTRYRFVDVNHTFGNGVMLDALYLGIPGQNELYLGAGYQWKATAGLAVTPLAYGVVGKENGERGLVLGAYVSVDSKRFKALAFLGRFVRLEGGVQDYDFLDSLDAVYVLGRTWEAGASSTAYRQAEVWTGLVGPMVRRNDARGSWALSLRGGYDTEVRLTRVVSF